MAHATEPAHARRSYAQFCPVARTLDIVGERWTLLVVRELMGGPQRFSDLRAHLPAIGGALLTQRLRDLEAAGLVHRRDLPPPASRTVYELTARGRDLEAVIYELSRFGIPALGMPTSEEPAPEHLVPLGAKTLVVAEALPKRALTVGLAFDERALTMQIAQPQAGHPIRRVTVSDGLPASADVTVRGSIVVALWLRQGALTLEDAQSQGLFELTGSTRAVAEARAMFGFS
jgi:DNA-binding HxlR family transcriptional regulator